MKAIKEIVNLRNDRHMKGEYGVEIEVEGRNLPSIGDLDANIWRVERDGSLKATEAWEYVMPKPLDLVGVSNSLAYLDGMYNRMESKVNDSVRAGVHVHMNVQEYNIVELMTFAVCYYLLEDVLMEFCGPTRAGNLFTLRCRDAEYNLLCLYRALRDKNLRHIRTDNIRYASLNFLSLFKYGSIEFRGMRGTGDLKEIYKWVEIIDDLKKGATQFNNPADVIMSMSGDGEWEFIKRILPNTYQHLQFKEELKGSVQDNARRLQMIAFEIDWTGFNKTNNNIFEVAEGGF